MNKLIIQEKDMFPKGDHPHMEKIRPQLLEDIFYEENNVSTSIVPPEITRPQLQEDIGGEFKQFTLSTPPFPLREMD